MAPVVFDVSLDSHNKMAALDSVFAFKRKSRKSPSEKPAFPVCCSSSHLECCPLLYTVPCLIQCCPLACACWNNESGGATVAYPCCDWLAAERWAGPNDDRRANATVTAVLVICLMVESMDAAIDVYTVIWIRSTEPLSPILLSWIWS